MKSDISDISQINSLNKWATTKHIASISHHTYRKAHSFNEVRFQHIVPTYQVAHRYH